MTIIPQGYKETEIGVLPDDWEVGQVGNYCTVFGRIGFRGYTVNDIVGFEEGAIAISPSNISENKLSFNKCTYLSWFKYHESPEIKIFNGDILLVKTGSTFGKTAIVTNLQHEATLNPQLVVLKNISINNFYLSYQFYFKIIQNQITSTIVGGAIPTLSQKLVEKFNFPIPQKPEQTAIANALRDIDDLITTTQTLIAKKKAIKTATMQQLLTPKEDWVEMRLGDVAVFSSGIAHENSITENGDFIVINSKFISTEGSVVKHSNSNLCAAHLNDILIVLSDVPNGKAIAKCFYVNENYKYTVNQRIGIIRSFGIYPKLLLYIVNRHNNLLSIDDGVKQTNFRNSDITELKIKFPLSQNIQIAIAENIDILNNELNILKATLTKYQSIKQGMMQNLLTGKIRLI
jgi:type I restriction enzyme S subunit